MPCLLLYPPRSSGIVQNPTQKPLPSRILLWSPQLESIALPFEFLIIFYCIMSIHVLLPLYDDYIIFANYSLLLSVKVI